MQEHRFNKVLKGFDILSMAFGAMIGWGWVVMSGNWLEGAGTLGAILAFVVGGVVVLFVGLMYAELTPALPRCGGEHYFSMRALGYNCSYVCTWALILGYIGVVAFEACALPSVFEYIFPGYCKGYLYEIAGFDVYASWVAFGVFFALLITAINYLGIQQSASFQNLLTGMIAITGVIMIVSASVAGDIANTQPLFKSGAGPMLSVVVMTPFLFMGFDVIPQMVEEIDVEPRRIGKTMILAISIALCFYILVILAVSMIMSDGDIAASSLVSADAIKKAWGGRQMGAIVIVVGGMAGILSSWNAFLVGGSRCIYAMACSGMLPAFLGKLHPKHKTPCNAILLIGVVSCMAPFFGKAMLEWMANGASFAMVIAYMLVVLSFLRLRVREPDLPRPYRVPKGKLVGRIALLLTGGMLVLYLPGMPSGLLLPEWIIVGIWCLVGVLMYRRKSHQHSSKKPSV